MRPFWTLTHCHQKERFLDVTFMGHWSDRRWISDGYQHQFTLFLIYKVYQIHRALHWKRQALYSGYRPRGNHSAWRVKYLCSYSRTKYRPSFPLVCPLMLLCTSHPKPPKRHFLSSHGWKGLLVVPWQKRRLNYFLKRSDLSPFYKQPRTRRM